MDFTTVRARFRGALLGVADGDALGAPFEGWAAEPWRGYGIPLRWREKVEGADELRRLADGLLILATPGVRIRRGPDPAEP